jgi:hypothetical protein
MPLIPCAASIGVLFVSISVTSSLNYLVLSAIRLMSTATES